MRVLAVIAAVVLGLVAGTAAALVTVRTTDDPGPTAPSEPAGAVFDPLGLGIPLVNRPCTGEGLLLVGYGDTTAPLRSGITDHPDLELTYLDTARSCETTYGPEQRPTPAYAVVAGPYPDLAEPCAERLTPGYRGDFVTHLREGNVESVKCVCELPASAGPLLTPGTTVDRTEAVWVKALQEMLFDLDPELFSREQITEQYDAPTVARIKALQATSVGVADGEMDEQTWALVRTRVCRLYDY